MRESETTPEHASSRTRGTVRDDARRIVDDCYDDVLAYCRRHAPAGVDPYDLTQEAFLRMVRAHGHHDMDRPLPYLITIARNLCIDASRKAPSSPLPLDFDVQDSRDGLADVELSCALARLDPQLREIVELRFDQTMSLVDIAEALGMSRFSVARRLRRALSQLKRELDVAGGEGRPTPSRVATKGVAAEMRPYDHCGRGRKRI